MDGRGGVYNKYVGCAFGGGKKAKYVASVFFVSYVSFGTFHVFLLCFSCFIRSRVCCGNWGLGFVGGGVFFPFYFGAWHGSLKGRGSQGEGREGSKYIFHMIHI